MPSPLLAVPSNLGVVCSSLPRGVIAVLALVLLPAAAALAQVETFINKPGSSVGPSTEVVPTNCVKGPDGSLTCDTKLKNPPSDTQAQPQYNPFKN
ncbi:MAG: hypothetical protein ACKO6F_09285 [Cyanobium sp.]